MGQNTVRWHDGVHTEDDMQHLHTTDDYQAALAEAANAFMKTMALRGYAVRDYPQNLVAHLARQTRLHFEANPKGAHPLADACITQFLQSGKSPQLVPKPQPSRRKSVAFPPLGQRQAA